MIQRIQTLYMAFSVILLSLLFKFEIATIEGPDAIYEYSILGLSQSGEFTNNIAMSDFPIFVFIVFTILVLIFAIFKFKRRKTQMNLARLALLLVLTFIVGSYFLLDVYKNAIGSDSEPQYHAGIYLAVACLPLIFLAIRGIKKDQKLIKSLDRIR